MSIVLQFKSVEWASSYVFRSVLHNASNISTVHSISGISSIRKWYLFDRKENNLSCIFISRIFSCLAFSTSPFTLVFISIVRLAWGLRFICRISDVCERMSTKLHHMDLYTMYMQIFLNYSLRVYLPANKYIWNKSATIAKTIVYTVYSSTVCVSSAIILHLLTFS